MEPNHHIDHSTLMALAAGNLNEALELVVSCHLQQCPQCQRELDFAEHVGGALLDHANLSRLPVQSERKQALMSLLQDDDIEMLPTIVDDGTSELPQPLASKLQGGLEAVKWRSLGPGMRQARVPGFDKGLRLLAIAPGTSMPLHSHQGSELTLVLSGSYSDELGRFQPGDVADLDPDVEHQPIVDRDQECICLVATDAPLHFRGIVPRLLQPFFGF